MQLSSEPESVRAALERVLSRPEFGNRSDPIEAWLRWLERMFQGSFAESGALQLAYWAFVVFLGMVLGWLACILIVRSRARSREGRSGSRVESAVSSGRKAAMLRERAAEARRASEHLLALRLYFLALVVGLSERGDLGYSDAWTNHELLERGEPQDEVRAFLSPLVEELDRKAFGRAPVGAADVERLARIVEQRLGSVQP